MNLRCMVGCHGYFSPQPLVATSLPFGNGRDDWTRTSGLLNPIQPRYQLRYAPGKDGREGWI